LNGQKSISKELINSGIDINIVDKNNRNVIFDAIHYGDENLINDVMDNNDIDLNIVDSSGKSILHTEEALSNEKLYMDLIKKKGRPNYM
jgi:ankyrin repeat protein